MYETEHITDLIEITAFNALQIRDIVRLTLDSGKVIRKPPHRHVIGAECVNEHPIAHALRDVLPVAKEVDDELIHPYCDFASLVGEHEITLPDFIRVQVRSGYVRVDDTEYVVIDGVIEASEHMRARAIYPGDDVSNEHEKTRLVCGIVHTADNITAYYTPMIIEATEKIGAATQEQDKINTVITEMAANVVEAEIYVETYNQEAQALLNAERVTEAALRLVEVDSDDYDQASADDQAAKQALLDKRNELASSLSLNARLRESLECKEAEQAKGTEELEAYQLKRDEINEKYQKALERAG